METLTMILEAIASVSLSHKDDCECDVCKAGRGDEMALVRVLAQLNAMTGGK